VNATTHQTAAGIFGGELAALGLSIGYDNCAGGSKTSNGCARLQDLHVCDQGQRHFVSRRCNIYFGKTISEIYQLANRAIGSCCNLEFEFQLCDVHTLTGCIQAINAAFPGGQNLIERFSLSEFTVGECPNTTL